MNGYAFCTHFLFLHIYYYKQLNETYEVDHKFYK
jgi:hypothetical protein